MNRFARIAGLAGMVAALAVTPVAAHAQDNNPVGDSAGPGGCHHTDKDGYDIPIHDGETVFVDGKLVTCKSGTIIITTAPLTVRPGTTKKPIKKLGLTKVKVTSIRS